MSSTDLRNISIDTNKLSIQLEKLKKTRTRIELLLNSMIRETNDLKVYWDSKTSRSVFKNFEEMYKGYRGLIDDLDKDIIFLRDAIDNYNAYERAANKAVDEQIAV